MKFPAGLIGNPNAVPKCTHRAVRRRHVPGQHRGRLGRGDGRGHPGAVISQTVTSPGTVYNLPAVGAEPARLGIKIRPAPLGPVTFQTISLVSVAKLGPETGYALETTIPNQPRHGRTALGGQRSP